MSRKILPRNLASGNMALGHIIASGLTLVERDRVRVAGLSLTVHAGEIVGLVGEPGSGKSQCLALIGGVIEPTFGVLRLSEEPFRVLQPSTAGSMGVDDRLAELGAIDSSVILVDEPMRGLAAEHAQRVWKALRNMSEAGKAVLISVDDSDLDSVDCDRLYLIENGVITRRGAIRDIRGPLRTEEETGEVDGGARSRSRDPANSGPRAGAN
jgi:ABC-type multidrug transport system ATPase subunit